MKRILNVKSILAAMALFLAVGAVDVAAQRPTIKRKAVVKRKVVKPAPVYTVADGTLIRARMNQTITSKTAAVGSTFTATVTEPVYSSTGIVVIPVGSTLAGRVDMVKRAAKSGKPGEIDAHFVRVRLPNGVSRAINGSISSLDADGLQADNEGSVSGKRMRHRKLIFIGGGGAGGAVIGGAVGGGKGALIGGLVGAGAGFLGDRMTKGKEAEVKSGTEFGVYLNQSIALPKFAETAGGYRNP